MNKYRIIFLGAVATVLFAFFVLVFLPHLQLLSVEPPIREPCRRLSDRLMALANGVAPLCGQDFHGKHRLGKWTTEPISAIWQGKALSATRAAHMRLDLEEMPLCARCGEWFRP